MLNALIGKSMLPCDDPDLPNTHCIIKILISSQNKLSFYEENEINNLDNEEEIKERINLVNAQNNFEKTWIFQTPFKHLQDSKDINEFIEFIDFPGISGIYENDENSLNLNEKHIFSKKIFNEILERHEIDGFLLMMNYKDYAKVTNFFNFFIYQLFSEGKNRDKLIDIMKNKNFIIIVNKTDGDLHDQIEENKKVIRESIFGHLLKEEKTGLKKYYIKFFHPKDEMNNILEYQEESFQQKSKEFPFVFISSKEALSETIEFEKNKFLEYRSFFTNEEFEIKLKENEMNEDKTSNFEELERLLLNLINMSWKHKIMEPLQQLHDDVYSKSDPCCKELNDDIYGKCDPCSCYHDRCGYHQPDFLKYHRFKTKCETKNYVKEVNTNIHENDLKIHKKLIQEKINEIISQSLKNLNELIDEIKEMTFSSFQQIFSIKNQINEEVDDFLKQILNILGDFQPQMLLLKNKFNLKKEKINKLYEEFRNINPKNLTPGDICKLLHLSENLQICISDFRNMIMSLLTFRIDI